MNSLKRNTLSVMKIDNMSYKTTKTNAQRQAEYRARQAHAGKAEVRGIFATPANAEKIRRYAAKLIIEV